MCTPIREGYTPRPRRGLDVRPRARARPHTSTLRWPPPSRSPPRSALAPRPPRADRPRSPRARPRRPPSRARSWCVHIDSTRGGGRADAMPIAGRERMDRIESLGIDDGDVDAKGTRAWGRCAWMRENSPVGCARCARGMWRRARVIVGGCAHRGPSRVTRALSAMRDVGRARGRCARASRRAIGRDEERIVEALGLVTR